MRYSIPVSNIADRFNTQYLPLMKIKLAPSTSALINRLSDETKAVFQKVMHSAATGHFMSFEYTDSKGKTSRKVYRFGGDISAKLQRDKDAVVKEFVKNNPGVPFAVKMDSKGNWVTQAKKSGLRDGIMEYNSAIYVRGTDVKSRNHRTLKIENMRLVK